MARLRDLRSKIIVILTAYYENELPTKLLAPTVPTTPSLRRPIG